MRSCRLAVLRSYGLQVMRLRVCLPCHHPLLLLLRVERTLSPPLSPLFHPPLTLQRAGLRLRVSNLARFSLFFCTNSSSIFFGVLPWYACMSARVGGCTHVRAGKRHKERDTRRETQGETDRSMHIMHARAHTHTYTHRPTLERIRNIHHALARIPLTNPSPLRFDPLTAVTRDALRSFTSLPPTTSPFTSPHSPPATLLSR